MRLLTVALWGSLIGGAASAQVPFLDQSVLNGKFNFVYGIYRRSNSSVAMGTLTFDGQGHYTMATGSQTAQGFYHIDPDGLGSLSNPFNPTLPPINLRLAAGIRMIGGSTLDQATVDTHDFLLAVPAATKAPSMAGNWGGITYLYTPTPAPLARSGRFRFAFDATGNMNSTTWTYHQTDVNNGAPQDISSTGTYSIDATGLGTYTSAQGTKRIAVSSDGSLYIGTDAEGLPEMIFGTRLSDGNPTAQGMQGRFWWYQLFAAPPAGGSLRSSNFAWSLGTSLFGVEGKGLVRGSGGGQFIDGPTGRLMDLSVSLGGLTIHPDSTVDMAFAGLGTPGLGVISADSTVVPWMNLSAAATGNYAFSIAMQGPSFQPGPGQTVFLDPNGPQQTASASAHPVPFAPGTLVTARGLGLAASSASASGVPLPNTLGSTSLTANGQPVGLVSVSPTAITFVMPWASAGAGKLRLKATVGGVDSNEIIVRATPTSVGFFSTTGDGLGTVLAQHLDGSLVSAASPAAPGETVVLYASGLGALSASVAEYGWATISNVTATPLQVEVGGVQANVLYAGAAPGYPGVYQINVQVPAGAVTSAGANLRMTQGYSQTHVNKVTIPIR